MACARSASESQIIDSLWQRVAPHVFITREQFLRSLEGWEMVRDDAFVAFVRGPEFHYSAIEPGKSLSRRAIRAFLEKIIAREGYALTRTPRDDTRQQRFNELIGFRAAGIDEFFIHYRIEKVR
jgi:hypothetical protein